MFELTSKPCESCRRVFVTHACHMPVYVSYTKPKVRLEGNFCSWNCVRYKAVKNKKLKLLPMISLFSYWTTGKFKSDNRLPIKDISKTNKLVPYIDTRVPKELKSFVMLPISKQSASYPIIHTTPRLLIEAKDLCDDITSLI